ncbi:MAG: 5'-3' exonuclease H3TH domain-containing protein [Verrucomicrobiota bacterium]|nr:5'-3' exonuclease H3TH domain-containing protein [Verrucomicrobiota bacterium]
MAKYLLLDGMNLAFRSFYGMPELARHDGLPTGAIHGWMRTLWMLEDQEKPDKLVVFFDLGAPTRHEALLPEYKANRSDCPPALAQQFPYIRRITTLLGLGGIEQHGVEADDLIAGWAKRLAGDGHEVIIVSADKDLGQLVGGTIYQLTPPPTANPKLGWRRLDAAGIEEKFGVPPRLVPELLALTGDSSDNIPGIDGAGFKTAAKWLNQYRSLEGVIDHCGELKPQRCQQLVHSQRDAIRRNLQMTTLDTSTTLASDTLETSPGDLPAAIALLEELEMRSTADQLRRRRVIRS